MSNVSPPIKNTYSGRTNIEMDEVFRDAMALYKREYKITDEQIAEMLECCRAKVCQIKKTPGRATLEDIRKMMHIFGATKEDWLKLGGY